MMTGGINFLDHIHFVEALKPTTPSSTTPAYISTKNAKAIGVLIHVANATTVTGSAITLKQATAVAGTSEKALGLPFYYKVVDVVGADVPWVKVAAVSDTFTTDATNSKDSLYFIPVDPASLDTPNSFDCLRVGTGNGVATTITAMYVIAPKHGGNPVLFPTFILD